MQLPKIHWLSVLLGVALVWFVLPFAQQLWVRIREKA